MRHSWITSLEDFLPLAAEWDAAAQKANNDNPFLLSSFITAWWQYFKKGKALRILALFDHGRLCAGLPLFKERLGTRAAGISVLRYPGGSAANYTEPFTLLDGAHFWEAFEEALGARRDWDALALTDVRASSVLVASQPSLSFARTAQLIALHDHDNYVLDLGAAAGPGAQLSKKLLKDLRAKRKHAETRLGPISLREKTAEGHVRELFDTYRAFSRAAFSQRSRRSAFEDGAYADFFRTFLSDMQRQGRLEAHGLYAGETILAISFAYRFGPGFNWVLTGFDYRYRYFRPGYLLIEEIIKMLLKRGETRYNWYGYGRFYKDQWCNRTEPLLRFWAIRNSFRGAAFWTGERIKQRARQNPLLAGIKRKLQPR